MQGCASAATTITVPLFDQEMKYLHDNGFKVLSLNQIGFDPNRNALSKNYHFFNQVNQIKLNQFGQSPPLTGYLTTIKLEIVIIIMMVYGDIRYLSSQIGLSIIRLLQLLLIISSICQTRN
jgi:hypothetical protein